MSDYQKISEDLVLKYKDALDDSRYFADLINKYIILTGNYLDTVKNKIDDDKKQFVCSVVGQCIFEFCKNIPADYDYEHADRLCQIVVNRISQLLGEIINTNIDRNSVLFIINPLLSVIATSPIIEEKLQALPEEQRQNIIQNSINNVASQIRDYFDNNKDS